jgi:ABC-type transport system substrate-binding protein
MAAGFSLAAEGKNLIYALGAEPVSLDPAYQTDNPSEIVVRHIHDNLVEFTEKGDIVPQLAASWGNLCRWSHLDLQTAPGCKLP